MKDELIRKIMAEFVALKAKAYFYLKNDEREVKKDKGTKTHIIERELKFQDYKN